MSGLDGYTQMLLRDHDRRGDTPQIIIEPPVCSRCFGDLRLTGYSRYCDTCHMRWPLTAESREEGASACYLYPYEPHDDCWEGRRRRTN